MSLKVRAFLVVVQDAFLRDWIKLYFKLIQIFDWNETFVFSYYISYYSIDCEMTADDSPNR